MDPYAAELAAAAGAPQERRYANHLRVGFNRLEFLLDFAQVYDGSAEFVHAQLVAAPAHVKQFASLMQGCINDYETRYGVIALDGPGGEG
ncbi:MAG: DUF3467 domain-containing protein [Rubrivivax sp.]|nr:DUF3467 domain-containing protein [Rubrivivax sp.]